MTASSARTSMATHNVRRSRVLHLHVDANRLWAGLYPPTKGDALAFSGCDLSRASAHRDSLIIGAHYPMSRPQLRKAIEWLRGQGVAVDVDPTDAAALDMPAAPAPAPGPQSYQRHEAASAAHRTSGDGAP